MATWILILLTIFTCSTFCFEILVFNDRHSAPEYINEHRELTTNSTLLTQETCGIGTLGFALKDKDGNCHKLSRFTTHDLKHRTTRTQDNKTVEKRSDGETKTMWVPMNHSFIDVNPCILLSTNWDAPISWDDCQCILKNKKNDDFPEISRCLGREGEGFELDLNTTKTVICSSTTGSCDEKKNATFTFLIPKGESTKPILLFEESISFQELPDTNLIYSSDGIEVNPDTFYSIYGFAKGIKRMKTLLESKRRKRIFPHLIDEAVAATAISKYQALGTFLDETHTYQLEGFKVLDRNNQKLVDFFNKMVEQVNDNTMTVAQRDLEKELLKQEAVYVRNRERMFSNRLDIINSRINHLELLAINWIGHLEQKYVVQEDVNTTFAKTFCKEHNLTILELELIDNTVLIKYCEREPEIHDPFNNKTIWHHNGKEVTRIKNQTDFFLNVKCGVLFVEEGNMSEAINTTFEGFENLIYAMEFLEIEHTYCSKIICESKEEIQSLEVFIEIKENEKKWEEEAVPKPQVLNSIVLPPPVEKAEYFSAADAYLAMYKDYGVSDFGKVTDAIKEANKLISEAIPFLVDLLASLNPLNGIVNFFNFLLLHIYTIVTAIVQIANLVFLCKIKI